MVPGHRSQGSAKIIWSQTSDVLALCLQVLTGLVPWWTASKLSKLRGRSYRHDSVSTSQRGRNLYRRQARIAPAPWWTASKLLLDNKRCSLGRSLSLSMPPSIATTRSHPTELPLPRDSRPRRAGQESARRPCCKQAPSTLTCPLVKMLTASKLPGAVEMKLKKSNPGSAQGLEVGLVPWQTASKLLPGNSR